MVRVGGQRMVGDISFQKMYGLYGLKHHILERSGDVTNVGQRNDKFLNCETLGFTMTMIGR